MQTDSEINRLVDTLPIGLPLAHDYQAAGGDFADDVNFHATVTDRASWLAAWKTFAKFGYRARAFFVTATLGAHQVEVIFDGGQEVVSFYNKLPNKITEPSPVIPVPAGFKGYVRITHEMTDWLECPMVPWSSAFDLAHAARVLEGQSVRFDLDGSVFAYGRNWQGKRPLQPRNHLASLATGRDVFGPVLVCFS